MGYITKSFLLLLITTIFSFPAISQVTQKGVVMEYRFGNKKKPLSGVEIEVKYAASTISDKKGNFLLSFHTMQPGDRVILTSHGIEKSGYEIFNKDAVDQWIISRDHKPFTVVMASSKRMKELRDDYSRLSSASYERQFQKESKRLEDERQAGKLKEKDYQRQLKDLVDWYEQQRGNINFYVDQFVRIDLNELSQEEADIILLVQRGEFEEAARKYESLGIFEKFEKTSNDIKTLKNDEQIIKGVRINKEADRDCLWESLQRKINFLKMYGGRECFDSIGLLLKKAVMLDSTYLKTVYYYADFVDNQRDYNEAIKYYSLSLSLTNDDDYENRSVIMSRLGNSYLRIGDYDNSEKYLLETIKILEKDTLIIDERKSELNRSAYNNIANLYNSKHCYNEAEKYYYLSLKHSDNPSDSINALYNLATMYNTDHGNEKSELSVCFLHKADSIIAQQDSLSLEDIYVRFNIKTQLLTSYGNLKQYNEVEKNFYDALQLSEILKLNNPQAYIADDFYLYNNYGTILIKQKRYEEAEVQFQNAYNLTKMFSGFQGKLLSLIVGGSLGDAQGCQISNRYKKEKGQALLDSICPEFELIYQSHPDVVMPYLSIFYQQYAYVYMLLGNYDTALDYINKAIDLTPDDSNCYDTKGLILFKKGDISSAKMIWDQLIKMIPNYLDKNESELYEKLFQQ